MGSSARYGQSVGTSSSKFLQYAKKRFLESTIAGVPQIVGAENIPKRLLRLTVFVSCLVGFTYQFVTFLWLYWKYPIVLDVQVSSPPLIDTPAFTVCDHSGMSLKKYCLDYPCYDPTDQRKTFCKTLRRYCRRGALLDGIRLPENHENSLEIIRASRMNRDLLRPDIEEKVNLCEMTNARAANRTDCGEVLQTPLTNGFLPTATDCHSYGVLWENPDGKPEKISSAANINLMLKVNGRDYLPTVPEKYLSMFVEYHNPRTKVNPFITGINVFRGKGYKFFIRQRVLKLLPPPYSTNCMDYMEAWEKNGGTGPTSQPECIEECKMKKEYAQLGCTSYYIWYPTDNPRCPTGCKNETCPEGFPVNPKLQEYSDECELNCRPGCFQEQYELSGEEMQVPEDEKLRLCSGCFR